VSCELGCESLCIDCVDWNASATATVFTETSEMVFDNFRIYRGVECFATALSVQCGVVCGAAATIFTVRSSKGCDSSECTVSIGKCCGS